MCTSVVKDDTSDVGMPQARTAEEIKQKKDVLFKGAKSLESDEAGERIFEK